MSEIPQHAPPNPDLTPADRAKSVTEEKLHAAVTHEIIRREGYRELHRTPSALGWSGLAGGVSMGLSLLTVGVLHHALPEAPWRPTVAALGYPMGFIAVILGSQQLYTENTLRPIVPLMTERTSAMLQRVLVLWAVVFAANLIGALLFGWAAAWTAMLPVEVRQAMRTVALEATHPAWWPTFARAIVAGWLVALLVWMLPAAGSSRLLLIVLVTWLIGAAKLSHVIVTANEAFYLMWTGDLSVWHAFGGEILPALLGNTLGGVVLVAALNHAQVESE